MALLPVGATAPAAVRAPASGPTFGDLLRARIPVASLPSPSSPGVRLLQAVEGARVRLDAALAEARRGRVFTAGELLGLQADAYRAGQTLELASKVVEQGAQSVRQAVGAQV
jgi:hypothetical protein